MVLRCAVKGCRRNSSSDTKHSFFRLPKDAETRHKWLKFVGKDNDCGHIRICTDHFDMKLIRKKYPRPLLVRNAVPTIQSSPEQNPLTKVEDEKVVKKVVEDERTKTQSPEESQSCSSSSPRTQVINIHANNVSQIIISGEKKNLIVNIINNAPKNADCTHEKV